MMNLHKRRLKNKDPREKYGTQEQKLLEAKFGKDLSLMLGAIAAQTGIKVVLDEEVN